MRHEKAAHLLCLARALAGSAEGLTIDDMAVLAGCNRRTAERMRDAVRELFPQLEELQDGPQKRFRIPGGLDGFMQTPTADELAELHAAAAALEAAGGAVRAGLLRALAAKITGALRTKARARIAPDLEALIRAEGHAMQVGPHPLADSGVLSAIRTALKSGSALRFAYAPDAARMRNVSPWGVLYGRSYYLVGPEGGHAQPVLWRLDRMIGPELAGPGRPPPAGWTIAEYAARSFGVFQEAPQQVVLHFSPAAAGDAGRFLFHPSQVFEPQADGSLVVRFTAGGMVELCNHLFGWGDSVTILEGDEMKRYYTSRLVSVLAHQGDSGKILLAV